MPMEVREVVEVAVVVMMVTVMAVAMAGLGIARGGERRHSERQCGGQGDCSALEHECFLWASGVDDVHPCIGRSRPASGSSH
jgi:hypothetical protein